MMSKRGLGRVRDWMWVAIGSLLTACSGATGTISSGATGAVEFRVREISCETHSVWQINRPIDVVFTADVDFDTVNSNTIQVGDSTGRPASGTFFRGRHSDGSLDPARVVFQPSCPVLPDFSDAGLLPGGVTYTFDVVGSSTAGMSVRSAAGDSLVVGRSTMFKTPNSVDLTVLFHDPVPGAPGVRLRGAGSIAIDEPNAIYLELGEDPANRIYFELTANQLGELPRDAAGNPFQVPLNRYSVMADHVAVVMHLDQPVHPDDANIDDSRVQLEYLDLRIPNPDEHWVAIATRVELVENCTATGSVLRLTPIGVLPQGATLRVNLRAEFADLSGMTSPADRTHFARMTTALVDNPGTSDPTRDSDEILETFLVGGGTSDSLEDTSSVLDLPRATWADGRLTARKGLSDTRFDWIVPPGTQVTVDTVLDRITGGDGAITGEQLVLNGVIEVRNVFIPAGSEVIFHGPNRVMILASGRIEIGGEISVSGGDNPGVLGLGEANIPEYGARGRAGGGNGGTGSLRTSQSTPRGGAGFGAFGRPNAGGGGGETSFHPTIKNGRRGSGGGAGRFGPDVYYPLFDDAVPAVERMVLCQTLQGMDAEPGFDGGTPQHGTGAVSQDSRAEGGVVGPGPFADIDDENDFYGWMRVDPGQPTERLVQGELARPWAGSGGGAGGDAVMSDVFPPPGPFDPAGDEKGAGGGAGGGSLTIVAARDIVVREGGMITADGGRGGGGENSLFFDRVGGGSGGGSGGHIVLSSRQQISIADEGEYTGSFYGDPVVPGIPGAEHPRRAISAIGGAGGPGIDNLPSSQVWKCDAIPRDRLDLTFPNGGAIRVPPIDEGCYNQVPGPPVGSPSGAGGDGGPGLIQLHVNVPALDLLFPSQQQSGEIFGVNLDVTRAMMPPPVGWHDLDDADELLPLSLSRSLAQSQWIRLGHGRLTPDPSNPGSFLPDEQVTLRFDGTDQAGSLERTGTDVDLVAPVIGPDVLGVSPALPYIDPASGGATMVMDASGLAGADEVYKRNAELNKLLLLRLVDSADPDNEQRFSVELAVYDPVSDQLRLTVSTANGSLVDFAPTGASQVSLVPTYFRVVTSSFQDRLPDSAGLVITFDATVQDGHGDPSSVLAYSRVDDGSGSGGVNGFTGDISDLNTQNWDFVRFRVLFDLDTSPADGLDLNARRHALEHLRIQMDY